MKKIRCAVIGVGYLGKFHAEKYAALAEAELVALCDTNAQRCQEMAQVLQVPALFDYRELIGKVDAVSIVVPTIFHYPVAKFFLEHGIHVLLEKPMTTTLTEAAELIKIAAALQLVLQIGHLERFNQVLQGVEAALNKPHFIEAHRLAPFNPRGTDVSVILDLMIHDIDLIQHLVKSPIKSIHANGASLLTNHIDIASARIQFENRCVANLTASRINSHKERRLHIFQADSYLTADLQNKHLSVHQKKSHAIGAEIVTDEKLFEPGDEIKAEIKAFLNSIIYRLPPVVSGTEGKNALATALNITQAIHSQSLVEIT